MDYEEKYKEALQAVNELKQINPYDDGIQKWADKYFPELKVNESEDEKIRKTLIEFFREGAERNYSTFGFDDKDIVAWLEKQKPTTDIQNLTWEDIEKIGEIINMVQYENPNGIGAKCLYTDVLERFLDGKQTKQKPADKVEPKFCEGDWITSNVSHEDYRICKILKIENGEYVIESTYGYKGYNNFEIFDKDYHLWTIQDAKDGDVLAYPDGSITLFKHLAENIYMAHVLWVDGHIELNNSCAVFNVQPATKEQRDLLLQKMHEAGYEWDAEKKELKKIEDKPVAIIPKFKVGDIIRHKKQGFTCKIIAVDTEYRLSECCGTHLPFDFQDFYELVEQNPAWSEDDEKILNMIISDYIAASKSFCGYQGKLDWLKLIKERVQSQPKQEWKQENTDDLTDFENAMMHIGGSFFSQHAGLDPNDTNAIKEQANLLLELVPKQEWSEEEQQIIEDAACIILDCVNIAETEKEEKRLEELADKLQDLKPHDTWKPSEEQMNSLSLATQCMYAEEDIKNLESLYTDLKKI